MSEYQKWRGFADLVFINYKRNKRELRSLEYDIIYGKSYDVGMPRGSDVSDPTGKTAERILKNTRMEELKREIAAVETVLSRLKPLERALMMRAYVDGRATLEGTAAYLGIEYRAAKRRKKKACIMLARELGWI